MFLILTHDVDWPKHGPGTAHILARRDRFDDEVVRRAVEGEFNPYYGVPKMIEIEEERDVCSTFFFRARYDDGSSVGDYRDIISELVRGGFEIGLHVSDTSSSETIASEKRDVEHISGVAVQGSRIHYLRISEDIYLKLARAGMKYDSSLIYSKEKIDKRNSGYYFFDGLCVFPITFMDAYMFTYMGMTEETIVNFIIRAIDELTSLGIEFVTLLWHDNAIMMKGGRIYPVLVDRLVSRKDITILRAIDAFKIVQNSI